MSMGTVVPPQTPPPLAVERQPAGEQAAIAEMLRELQRQLQERYVDRQLLVRRDAHPKHHRGLVRATLTVDPNCPRELRHGIFTPGASYPAMLRFSNGQPEVGHDLVRDVRGLAIKLTGDIEPSMIDGKREHDLLLATGEAFFGSDAVDYAGFPAASTSSVKLIRFFVRPNRTRLRAGWRLLTGMTVPASPFDPNYFSQAPYRLGPHCVKYLVRRESPVRAACRPLALRAGIRQLLGGVFRLLQWLFDELPWRNVLGDVLVCELSPPQPSARSRVTSPVEGRHDAAVILGLYVQRWRDAARLPTWAIEDATRTWPDPYQRVASIEVPFQPESEIDGRKDAAEHSSFHPWRVSREHQPLGGISRARLAVYSAMSRFRHQKNEPQAS